MPGDDLQDELRGAIDDARRLQAELEQVERAMAAELAAEEAAEAAAAQAEAAEAEAVEAKAIEAEALEIEAVEMAAPEPVALQPVAPPVTRPVPAPPPPAPPPTKVRRRRGVLLLALGPVLLLVLGVLAWSLGLLPAGVTGRGAGAVAGQRLSTGGAAGPSGPDAAAGGPAQPCVPLRVVAAGAVAGVLRAVAAGLTAGPDCSRVEVTVAEGRAAGAAALAADADVWVPDDASWAGSAPEGLLPVVPGGQAQVTAPVLASSPLLLVTDRGAAGRIAAAGGGWQALDRLVGQQARLRLVTADPQSSGDGLLAVGGVGEVVWLSDGMDASAAALSALVGRTRTAVPGDLAPERDGEVAVLPEFRLPASGPGPGRVVVVPRDRTALLRFSWLVTRAGLADPARSAALQRLAAALTGPVGAQELARAGLRAPDGRRFPASAAGAAPAAVPDRLPAPLPVLEPHHVDHVFATWYPADRAVDLLVVVDVSRSMSRIPDGSDAELITLVKQGCRRVAELLPDRAGLGVWAFGRRLDGGRDYLELVAPGPLDRAHRRRVDAAVGDLVTRRTATGLYDTILAAYSSAVARARPGVPAQVLVFTDGRDESDPGSVGAAGLTRELAAIRAANPAAASVSLGVMAFGDADPAELTRVLAPVQGYVDPVGTAGEVADAFLHLAAGGLHA